MEIKNQDQELDEFIKKGRWVAWIAYMGLLIIIPAVLQRDNPYTVYHVKQGLALMITSLLTSLFTLIPQIGMFIGITSTIVLLTLNIIGIINAISGKMKPLPIIGKIGESFDF